MINEFPSCDDPERICMMSLKHSLRSDGATKSSAPRVEDYNSSGLPYQIVFFMK